MTNYYPLSVMQHFEQQNVLYLTGSRFLGCHKTDSDTDFMVVDKEGVCEFLKNNNFVDISNIYNHGNDHNPKVYRLEEHNIDIQVLPIELLKQKLTAQDRIKAMLSFGFAYPVTKQKRKAIWEWAMTY
jgi:hypothetical protein